MFVDASAIVAILNREPESDHFIGVLDKVVASTSAVALFEAAHAVAREQSVDLLFAAELVLDFLDRSRIDIVPISARTGRLAIEAAASFGKRSGHAAKLNMGDCFSYACAKSAGVPLLYKATTSPARTSPDR